jgi:GGDEF domain-containing protein
MKKNQPSDIHKARAEFAQELMRPVERGLKHTLRRAKDVYEQQNTSALAAMIVAVEKDREARVIEQRANYDDLTGLLRRGAFTTKVEQQILSDPTRQGVMVFFDIDKFKSVNDSFGHEAGDEVLQTFAQAIQKKIGNSGTVKLSLLVRERERKKRRF